MCRFHKLSLSAWLLQSEKQALFGSKRAVSMPVPGVTKPRKTGIGLGLR